MALQPSLYFPHSIYEREREMEAAYKARRIMEVVKPDVPESDALRHISLLSECMDFIPWEVPTRFEGYTITTEKRDNPRNPYPPPKMNDPGTFSIPCLINWVPLDSVTCDLGGSVNLMSRATYLSTGLRERDLKPTERELTFANSSVQKASGLAVDVPVWIGEYKVLCDFFILDMAGDDVPILLGRPFLMTTKAVFDIWNGNLTLRIDGNEITFNMDDPSTHEFQEYKRKMEEEEEASEISDDDFSESQEGTDGGGWMIWGGGYSHGIPLPQVEQVYGSNNRFIIDFDESGAPGPSTPPQSP